MFRCFLHLLSKDPVSQLRGVNAVKGEIYVPGSASSKMKSLNARPGCTAAQFAQAVGAVCYGYLII